MDSNAKTLLEEGEGAMPATLDQLYESGNPEEGARLYHHISMAIQPFLNGDTFYVPVGGGAGYGDCLERDPGLILKDLADGLVSPWAARNIYQVAYDEQTLRLDPEKTAALRDEARRLRKERGKPYAEFEAEWLKLRPKGEVLKYFGSYPYPSKGIQAGL